MATAGAHPNAGHAPDARCVFPEQTPRNVSGVLQPKFSGFSRRSSGSRRPRALDYRPPRRGNPPTPASSAFDRRAPRAFKTRACARGCARRASRRRRDRPFRARRRIRARPRSWRRGRARGDPSAARLRAAARVPASLHASRGRFRAATFNGLKGPRRGSKRARPGRAAAFFSRRTVFSDTRVFHVFTFFLDARNFSTKVLLRPTTD
jgi:hypothetical protein